MGVSTNSLLNKLTKGKNINTVLDKHETDFYDCTIAEYLMKLCEERNTVPERVINKAQIERTYGHQIFNGTRTPSVPHGTAKNKYTYFSSNESI